MNTWLVLAFLFFIGALCGWCIEFLFRNLISHKGPRGKYFINPGFCKGPYLPIYGIGLSVMFLMSLWATVTFETLSPVVVILCITICMTLIEFIGGLFLLKVLNLRLWDYRDRPGNVMGIICPLFTVIWGAIGAVYYLFIHEHVFGWLEWLSNNLAFSFFIGLFFGVFIIDLITSTQDASFIKEFAQDHEVVVKYEELKALVQKRRMESEQSRTFFHQTTIDKSDLEKELGSESNVFLSKEEATRKANRL